MHIASVLFDFVGTLVWPEPPGEALFCEACQLIGFEVHPLDLYKAAADIEADQNVRVEMPIKKSQEADFFAYGNMTMLKHLGFDATLSHGWFIYHYVHDRMQYHKFHDVDSVLPLLREAGLKLGIVSNAVPSTRDKIHVLGLARYFDVIILSGEAGCEKPDPEIFERALAALAVDPEETVYVGDDPFVDVKGAHAVGMTPVLLDRSATYQDTDCIRVKNLAEFLELIHIFK